MSQKGYRRVVLNVPSHLDEQYKEMAQKRGIPKTSMISYAMSWFLDYSKTIDMMPKMFEALTSVSKKD